MKYSMKISELPIVDSTVGEVILSKNIHPKLRKLPSPEIVKKGWGFEKIYFNCEELCGKTLHFNKDAKFSAHFHLDKKEYFTCVFGHLIVEGTNTEDASKYTIELKAGDTLEVPRRAIHQITAVEESEIVEFSTHHSNSDSFRVIPGDSQTKSKEEFKKEYLPI